MKCFYFITGIFRSNSFFVGANSREAINSGRGDFVPVFLSEIPLLFHRKIVPVDVALLQITPADSHGYCSLGTSVDCTRAALQHAKYVIGQFLFIIILCFSQKTFSYFQLYL